jgi:hypothetical protein
MPRRDFTNLRLKLPNAWLKMADQLALITDQTRSAYLREALIRQMMEDWALTPGRGFWVRPNVPVYKVEDGRYTQIATTLGGERIWPLQNMGYLPASAGGALLFRCDILPVGSKSGLTMSDAIVPRDGFGGPA